MKKFTFKENLIGFHGNNYLAKNNNYFEGWYYKNVGNNEVFSIIPGININENEKKAFIQIITNNNSYYFNYDVKDFKYSNNPFYIKIKKNFFSLNKIHIDIVEQNIKIYGTLYYRNPQNIKTNLWQPNIMGPFSYLPFMECNHAILNTKNRIYGFIKLNNRNISFKKGSGYIEKDWGISFPKNYIWMQGNNFKNSNTSFMLSIANIPFKTFQFTGLICTLIIDNQEYRFTTYNFAKVIKFSHLNNNLNIIIKKRNYLLIINAVSDEGHQLIAPINGKMTKNIVESINSKIKITLKKDNQIIYSDQSSNCGLEIVK